MNGLQALFDTHAAGVPPPQLALVFEAYAGYDNVADFNSPALLRPYETFVRRFGQDVTLVSAGNGRPGWRKASPERLNRLREWFDDPKQRFHDSGTTLFRGGSRDIGQAPTFWFTASPRDSLPSICCQVALPLTDENLAQAGMLVREFFGGQFPLASAAVGFGLAYDHLSWDHIRIAGHYQYWAQRHPGLTTSGISQHQVVRGGGVHDVNWITVLGRALSERMGGLAALQEAVAVQPAISCEAFEADGVLIKAGSVPQLGDTTQGDEVELYGQVGRVLAKLREGIPTWPERPGMTYEPGWFDQWNSRFFAA